MSRRLIFIAAVSTFFLFAAVCWFSRWSTSLFSSSPQLPQAATPLPPPPAPVVYGIATDSLRIVEGVIQSGQTLSTLLAPYHISTGTIHALVQKANKAKAAVRGLRRGRGYTLLHSVDASATARYLIYEPNQAEYVIYDLRDTLAVTRHQRDVDTVETELAGEIRGSLYQSILAAGGTAQLVNQLADIYGWRLDLNRSQPGDTFKLIVEEKQIEGKSMGKGRLKAAFLEYSGKPLYAIGFDQGQGLNYFDQDGKSFKKAFLKLPLEYSRISSRYTYRRFHPVQKRFKAHLGTDFAAPRGTPIRTVGDGVVLEASRTAGNGRYVKIRHNKTYTTQYLHMSRFAKGIRRGTRVSMGQTIGYVGSTGLATGPHLCYRFWKNGRQVDALREKLPLAKPIEKEYLAAFEHTKEKMMGRMEAMEFTPTPTRQEMVAFRKSEKSVPSI